MEIQPSNNLTTQSQDFNTQQFIPGIPQVTSKNLKNQVRKPIVNSASHSNLFFQPLSSQKQTQAEKKAISNLFSSTIVNIGQQQHQQKDTSSQQITQKRNILYFTKKAEILKQNQGKDLIGNYSTNSNSQSMSNLFTVQSQNKIGLERNQSFKQAQAGVRPLNLKQLQNKQLRNNDEKYSNGVLANQQNQKEDNFNNHLQVQNQISKNRKEITQNISENSGDIGSHINDVNKDSFSLLNLDYMIQSRPTTKHEALRSPKLISKQTLISAQDSKHPTSLNVDNYNTYQHEREKDGSSHQELLSRENVKTPSYTQSRGGSLVSPKSQNVINYRNIVRNRLTYSGRNQHIIYQNSNAENKNQISEFNLRQKSHHTILHQNKDNVTAIADPFGHESAKLFKQMDIPVDSQATLKKLKENYIQNINYYSQVVKDYMAKISSLSQLLTKIEFTENFRTIQDLQELFKYCRDKITLTEKHIDIEQAYYQNKRQIELKTIELSQFKSKCKRQEETLKKLQDENKDLRRQVLAGIEERTAMFKLSQTEQTKISSMQLKVDGLEQGLLTLSGDNVATAASNNHINSAKGSNGGKNVFAMNNMNENLRQNRLKTTIHVLIMENNTLKKELSFMKNQNDEQIEEINRLKKKINHLVMKIDEQNKKFAQHQFQKNAGFMELMNVKEQEIFEQDQELENSGLEEFEKLKDKLTSRDDRELEDEVNALPADRLTPSLNINEEVQENQNARKSTFNLQGPYWKNRTNDILKHDREKRIKLQKYDSVEQFKALAMPSLLTRDGREKRHWYDFRFEYMGNDETAILKEINQMGIHNYIETTMSLKSIEIKKNIELVTREYVINNTIRRVYEFVCGQVIEYFLHGTGDLSRLIININSGMCKILGVKDFRIWLRDVMNNYLWTYSVDANYEQYDLTHSEKGQFLINLKEAMYDKFRDLNEENSLLVPLYNHETDINSGIVQLVQENQNITNMSDLNKIQYEGQISATIIAEIITSVLIREQSNRVQYYYLGKQVQVQKSLINLLNQTNNYDLFKAFEKDMKLIFGVQKVRFAFLIKNTYLWNFIQTESQLEKDLYQELDINTNPSLMSITLAKNQSLVFFMPYQNLSFDSRLDLDTTLPLNSIPMKSASGQTIGVLQFENKQVKNRNEHQTKLQNQMITSLNDEGIMSIVRQISSILQICLEKVKA